MGPGPSVVRTKKGNPSKQQQVKNNHKKNGTNDNVSHPKKNKGTVKGVLASQDVALNPPFDPRMRRIGSPLNSAINMKRGWIQNEDGTKRVNFLFNPPAIDVSSAVDPAHTRTPLQKSDVDVTNVDYTSTGSSTALSLFYDRTYELFSTATDATSVASQYGVYADVLAWYTFLEMLDEFPASWDGVLFNQPMHLVPSYLFVGPSLFFYGYVTSLTATVTHWTQYMIPQRGKVDIGFTILPLPGGNSGIFHTPGDTSTGTDNVGSVLPGWLGSLVGGGFDATAVDPENFNDLGTTQTNPFRVNPG